MMNDERLAQLVQFTKALVDANQAGVYQVPLMATPEEALDLLFEVAQHRSLAPLWEPDNAGGLKLRLVKADSVQ